MKTFHVLQLGQLGCISIFTFLGMCMFDERASIFGFLGMCLFAFALCPQAGRNRIWRIAFLDSARPCLGCHAVQGPSGLLVQVIQTSLYWLLGSLKEWYEKNPLIYKPPFLKGTNVDILLCHPSLSFGTMSYRVSSIPTRLTYSTTTYGLHYSSSFWFIFRILQGNPEKEPQWSLQVSS